MKQSLLIIALLQGAIASESLFRVVNHDHVFLWIADEPAAKEEPVKAELPPSEDKVPDANVKTIDDEVDEQIKKKLEEHDKKEKMPITDENKEGEQAAVIAKFKHADSTESEQFDLQHDAWFKRDMAARKAKTDAVIKKAGGHVKTELDDKKEEELTEEDKAKKSEEKAEETKAKETADKEADLKAKKIEKNGEKWTAEMPQKFFADKPPFKSHVYE